MSNLNQFLSGGVKSPVQRGLTTANLNTTALNVTISAVDVNKSFLVVNQVLGTNGASAVTSASVCFTSATNVQIVNSHGDGSGQAPIVAWEVVENY